MQNRTHFISHHFLFTAFIIIKQKNFSRHASTNHLNLVLKLVLLLCSVREHGGGATEHIQNTEDNIKNIRRGHDVQRWGYRVQLASGESLHLATVR